jgi:translation initiation factor 2 beta subunit (eIF-2beta)/eIF-5
LEARWGLEHTRRKKLTNLLSDKMSNGVSRDAHPFRLLTLVVHEDVDRTIGPQSGNISETIERDIIERESEMHSRLKSIAELPILSLLLEEPELQQHHDLD